MAVSALAQLVACVRFDKAHEPDMLFVEALTEHPGTVCTEYVFCEVYAIPSTMSISPPLGQPPEGLVGTVHQAGQIPHPTGMCAASRIKTPVVKESRELTRTDFMYGTGAADDVEEEAELVVDEELLLEVVVEAVVVTACTPNEPSSEAVLVEVAAAELDEEEDEEEDEDEAEVVLCCCRRARGVDVPVDVAAVEVDL